MPKETASETGTRCGFAAVIGAPNAGKSTLVNALVGAKVSIVTHKAQTTRARVRGIALEGRSQIVLVDTPGISVTPPPQHLPARQTQRNNLPADMPAATTHRSTAALTQSGTGTVLICPPFPTRQSLRL